MVFWILAILFGFVSFCLLLMILLNQELVRMNQAMRKALEEERKRH